MSAAAGVGGGAAAAIAVINEQEHNDDEQDPGAVVATEEIPQTHNLDTSLQPHSMPLRGGGFRFFRHPGRGPTAL